jgi:CubicO group peptidase (beta-lactamase class C family)
MVRFADALTGGRLLNAPLAAAATSARIPAGLNFSYGYGFGVMSGPVRSFDHNGGAPGMNGELLIFPDSGYVVAILANTDPPIASLIAGFVQRRIGAQ